MSPEIAARLNRAGIQLIAERGSYILFARDECAALVHLGEGIPSIGSAGLMTPNGLAYLLWRDQRALLAARNSETPATPEQVETLRRFSADLSFALGL